MELYLSGHDFRFETENLCRIFFPYEPIAVTFGAADGDAAGTRCSCTVTENAGICRYSAQLQYEGKTFTSEKELPAVPPPMRERPLVLVLFAVLTQATGYTPPWGILTGVHPIKLFSSLQQQRGTSGARAYFEQELLVRPDKAQLAARTAANQRAAVEKSGENSYSLYVSIPFCPSRCSYCSFVSQTVERSARLLPEYVQLLCKELELTAKTAKDLGLCLSDVYIGGGTPTTLSAPQLTLLIDCIRENFGPTESGEFTVEAGRPDTITPEKLQALKDGGVTRISINPQSLNDQVLQNIGRRHTAAQTIDAFLLARSLGFANINTDLIVGLPGDTPQSFRETLDRILALGAENITVHSLALKHSSKMIRQEDVQQFHADALAAEKMLEYAASALTNAGYEPYYLYRQSRMVGNQENTGWSLPGYVCSYNVYTMDETHTVLACGAGGVTKVKSPYSERLERIFNFKYSYEYVSRFEEILHRKDGITKLYEQFRKQLS